MQDCSGDGGPVPPSGAVGAERAARRRRRSRLERAGQFTQAESALCAGRSQRQVAVQLGVARSTLQEWCTDRPSGQAPAALAAFIETPEGVEWLHRQVVAAHFIITLVAGAGVRPVCQFLQLSGLSAFVGASYGTQQRLNAALEVGAVEYAREQRRCLAEGMPRRQVTLCEDETFHPEICLVGLEPVSNFIILEQYAQDRTARTWTRALEAALGDLPVAVVQGTSDEGKGLLRHIQKDLGAHHSPDLFHVQHEVSQATGLNLARQVKQADEAVAQAQAQVQAARAAQVAYETQPRHPRGRPPMFEQRIEGLVAEAAEAERQRVQAQDRQIQARQIVREFGILYHPYDLQTGQVQPVERVAERFRDGWARLEHLAAAADLPTRARQQIEKAQRVTAQLLATLVFFFTTLHAKVEALNLAPALEMALHERLIPAIYLDRVADRSSDAEQRHQLRAISAQLLDPLRQPGHALHALPAADRGCIEQVAAECADLFQRSSSSVEGRNGHLALHHHGRHRLSDRKLAALTAVHNYFIRRPDGTTAAQRFFGRPPAPMFEQILERLPLPPRPARRRPRPPKPPYLLPVAA